MEILFQDNHVLAANKPAGISTQPSGSEGDNLEQQAKEYIKQQYNKAGAVFLHAIHRIDKPVSGIVLFARTSKALSRLQMESKQKSFHKVYRAVVQGNLTQTEGVLEHYLLHKSFHASVVTAQHPEAKLARLSYRSLATTDETTFIEIVLDTGRYHQIRAQFAAIGHPIVGDTKYGALLHPDAQGNEIALHHYELNFVHPTLKTTCSVQAPLPQTLLWQSFSY